MRTLEENAISSAIKFTDSLREPIGKAITMEQGKRAVEYFIRQGRITFDGKEPMKYKK